MKFSYEDLISGDLIPAPGVGHIRSPQLKELKPTMGVGKWTYNIYLNLLVWDKDDIIKYAKFLTGKKLNAIINSEKLNTFDVVTLIPDIRAVLIPALSFFMDETIEWDEKKKRLVTYAKNTHEEVGYIDRDNFDEVRDMMLQVNYVSEKHKSTPPKFSSKKSQELWERVQKHLREDASKTTEDSRMQLANIISKLSCAPTGYTLLNIYDLTVFQLYDQFFQYGYLRAMNLSEMAYSNHGGKDFNIQAWLEPITKYNKEKN